MGRQLHDAEKHCQVPIPLSRELSSPPCLVNNGTERPLSGSGTHPPTLTHSHAVGSQCGGQQPNRMAHAPMRQGK
eukprot:12923175-Prorocentrum_lima.AAC.1